MAAKKKKRKLVTREINFLILVLAFILAVGIIATKKVNPTRQITEVIENSIENMNVASTKVEAQFDSETRILTSPEIKRNTNFSNDLYIYKDEKSYSFSLPIPEGWEITQNEFLPVDGYYLLELEKDKHWFTIEMPPIESGFCDYKQTNGRYLDYTNYEADEPEYFNEYSELETALGKLRISLLDNDYYGHQTGYRYSVCTIDPSTNLWLNDTKIGRISIYSQNKIDLTVTNQLIKTLKEVQYQ